MFEFIDRHFEKRRLRRLVHSLPPILRKRYGRVEYYTEGQITKTIEDEGYDPRFLEYAVAMFAEPKEAGGILIKLGSSKTAVELRKFLLTNAVGGYYVIPGDIYSENENFFDSAISGTASSSGSGGFSDGGFDGGGGDGGGSD
ncbi:MAG: DUF6559 family protein [Verrucomicrobiota bacterium]